MPQVIASEVFESTLTLLRETFEGAQGSSTYYVDNAPGGGFFGTIEKLDAARASRPISKSGATIAGHVHHAGFHLDMTTGWIRVTARTATGRRAGPSRRSTRWSGAGSARPCAASTTSSSARSRRSRRRSANLFPRRSARSHTRRTTSAPSAWRSRQRPRDNSRRPNDDLRSCSLKDRRPPGSNPLSPRVSGGEGWVRGAPFS